jgi:hypothetical protein
MRRLSMIFTTRHQVRAIPSRPDVPLTPKRAAQAVLGYPPGHAQPAGAAARREAFSSIELLPRGRSRRRRDKNHRSRREFPWNLAKGWYSSPRSALPPSWPTHPPRGAGRAPKVRHSLRVHPWRRRPRFFRSGALALWRMGRLGQPNSQLTKAPRRLRISRATPTAKPQEISGGNLR